VVLALILMSSRIRPDGVEQALDLLVESDTAGDLLPGGLMRHRRTTVGTVKRFCDRANPGDMVGDDLELAAARVPDRPLADRPRRVGPGLPVAVSRVLALDIQDRVLRASDHIEHCCFVCMERGSGRT
jgi:hypothetical protein